MTNQLNDKNSAPIKRLLLEIRLQDGNERLKFLLEGVSALKERDLFHFLTYASNGATTFDCDVMRNVLSQLVPQMTERTMGWLSQSFHDKDHARKATEEEGDGATPRCNRGIPIGVFTALFSAILAGGAAVLARLLEKRFGELPESVQDLIHDGSMDELMSWVERTLVAPDLKSVLESD